MIRTFDDEAEAEVKASDGGGEIGFEIGRLETHKKKEIAVEQTNKQKRLTVVVGAQ